MKMTDTELVAVNLMNEQLAAFQKQVEIDKLKLTVNNLQNELLATKIELLKRDKKDIESEVAENNSKFKKFRDESRSALQKIASRYPELKDKKWGYDPDTGYIVPDNT